MFEVAGRRVKVVTGRQTQTVNVCTSSGQEGQYDIVVRLRPPFTSEALLISARFRSVEEMVSYLRSRHSAELEGSRTSSAGSAPRASAAPAKPKDVAHVPLTSWGQRARAATEESIDALVSEFIRHPYLHRVEHSIHCRLFELMADRAPLHDELHFGRWVTQPIHKEWPEYVPRPEKGNRRGNFDLVVLSPDVVSPAGLGEFRNGTIRPSIVIEMGLDYRYGHLSGDVSKLRNSVIRDSYLIHLVREGVPDDYPAVERLLLDCGFKTAYVRHTGDRVRFKLIGDAAIREQEVERS